MIEIFLRIQVVQDRSYHDIKHLIEMHHGNVVEEPPIIGGDEPLELNLRFSGTTKNEAISSVSGFLWDVKPVLA